MEDFDTIFRNHYRQLFLYALKFIDHEEDAHNIIQDIFMTVYEQRLYKKKQNHLKPYLFNAVRNSCLNFLKHEKVVNRHRSDAIYRLKELELSYYDESGNSLIEKETLEKIHEAIGSLPELQREILLLSRFEGLKNREISEKLDIPVRTVETRIFRALSTLRQKLSEKTFYVLMHLLCSGRIAQEGELSV
jgi:RNA polymerase sigma-70 factor, ECF subfamily